MRPPDNELTRLLQEASPDYGALMPLVYRELRAMAQTRLGGERLGHTLSATALVHEAFLKLTNGATVSWSGRSHFFTVASSAMRRVLIDHARGRSRQKRGGKPGDIRRVDLSQYRSVAEFVESDDPQDLLSLDAAVCRLEEHDQELALLVRLRFYSGLSIEHTAAALELSPATVKRRWAFARAWLAHALQAHGEGTRSFTANEEPSIGQQ